MKNRSNRWTAKWNKNRRGSISYWCHFLRKTGIAEIDETIFSDKFEWDYLEYLKTGSTSFGIFDTKTGYLNTNSASLRIKMDVYRAMLKGILKGGHKEDNFKNERDKITSMYGKRIASMYNDLSLKYFGVNTEEQMIGSLSPLACTQRIKAFTEIMTRYLKKIKSIDDIISYHNSKDGSIYYSNFVPKKMKYQEGWAGVEELLEKKGIEVRKNVDITYDKKSKGYDFEKGNLDLKEYFKVFDVIDTVNTKNLDRVKKSQTILLFLGCNEKPIVKNHFISSYTKNDVISRVTLCHNINEAHNGIVVEVVKPIDLEIDIKETQDKCVQQLKEYKIIGKEAKITILKTINIKESGFQPKLLTDKNSLAESKGKKGIASGQVWFMNEVVNG